MGLKGRFIAVLSPIYGFLMYMGYEGCIRSISLYYKELCDYPGLITFCHTS